MSPVKERFAYVIVDKDGGLVTGHGGRGIWLNRSGPVQVISAKAGSRRRYWRRAGEVVEVPAWQQYADSKGWRIVPCKLVPVEETDV